MVSDPTDLAILGAAPHFSEPLHVGRPNIGDRRVLLERIESILDRNWLTNDGPQVREFEQRIRDLVGVEHCVAMANGTIALEIAIRAIGLTGEVILPAYTFVATAHALAWQEIEPVFCDIDPISHNIDPKQIEPLITPRTSGIIGVHLWGRPCDIESMEQVAADNGLELLFDAAHALGVSYKRKMIGGFGRAEVFSFHATKVVNAFEGGAVVTNDAELADRMRRMRNFGFAGFDDVASVGTNGKMSEISAAMGLASLDSMDDFFAKNQRNYLQYDRRLSKLSGVTVLPYNLNERTNCQYVVIEVDENEFGLTRDELVIVLQADGVLARRYFYPGCHKMDAYRHRTHAPLPVTDDVARRVLLLPTGSSMKIDYVDQVADIIELARMNAPRIRARLGEAEA